MTYKIRVLGYHLAHKGLPIHGWAYHAEVYDDGDPSNPVWTCTHDHQSPQLAHGCAANWVEGEEGGPQAISESATG